MKNNKIITKTAEEIESITCDKCGKTAKFEDYAEYQQFVQFKWYFGYGSKYDCDTHKFDLCQECYDALIFSNVKVQQEYSGPWGPNGR